MRIVLTCLILFLVISCNNNKPSDEPSLKYIPVKQNKYWGFIDQSGKMIVSPQFDQAYSFSEGLAVIRNADNKYGFINESGEYKIAATYKDAGGFSEGLANVVRENEKVEYIDKSGKVQVVLDGEIEDAYPFKENMALVKAAGKYGFINKEGKVVIPAQYEEASPFSEGLASVRIEENDKGKYGFINKEGKYIINPQFERAGSFNEGMARIRTGDKYGYINKEGKITITPQYDESGTFSEGLAPARQGELWGFIDKSGKWKINPQFKDATEFSSSGLASARSTANDKWGFINKKGEWQIDAQFENVLYAFFDGVAVAELNDKYGLIDTKGRYKVNPQYESVSIYSKNYSSVESDYFDIGGIMKLLFNDYSNSLFKKLSKNSTYASLQKDFTNMTHDNYSKLVPVKEEENKNISLKQTALYFKDGFMKYNSDYTLAYNDNTPLQGAVFTYTLSGKASEKGKDLLKLLRDKVPADMQNEYKEGEYLLVYNSGYYVKIAILDGQLYLVMAFSKSDVLPDTYKEEAGVPRAIDSVAAK